MTGRETAWSKPAHLGAAWADGECNSPSAPKDVVALMVFKDADHVDWLLRWLVAGGAHVVLHIDKKSMERFAGHLSAWNVMQAVHVLRTNVTVNWAGFSQVEATLRCVTWALEHLPNFQRLHLMSGECLPLRPLADIASSMDQMAPAGAADLIECRDRPGAAWRINRYNIFGENPRNREHWHNVAFRWFRDLQVTLRLPTRSNFAPDDIVFGGQWWSMRRSSLVKMLAQPALQSYCRKFRFTRCSDEHFFQILHKSQGLRAAGSHRFVEFPDGRASPRHLDLQELQRLRDQGYLFARKVAPEIAQAYWTNAAPANKQ